MSTVKVAINGFGRIGRLAFRQIHGLDGIEVVAINDLTSPKVLAHLLKYDSAQGRFDEDVKATENSIIVDGEEVKIYAQKNPAEIPWKQHDVDVVLECTGFFTDKDKAAAHLTAGAKRVVISAPATGDLKTIVFNVNHNIPFLAWTSLIKKRYLSYFVDFKIHCCCLAKIMTDTLPQLSPPLSSNFNSFRTCFMM